MNQTCGRERQDDDNQSLTMKKIISKLDELNSNSIKLQKERVQHNIMRMSQLTYYRQIYV
jgi:hypothetical protein